jgi:GT2 family glycosyltransferase
MRPVHIVIVAYYGVEALERCLQALSGSIEVTIVDNSGSADVRAAAAQHGAEYVAPGRNLGFASGVNVALRRLITGPPRDVLLLNPDASVTATQVGELERFLHSPQNEAVGTVSPRLIDQEGREQRVVWPYPSPARAWAEALGFGRLRPKDTFLIGAALLLRWEALLQVGLFDERFFLYAEEADWQRRALEHGWAARLCHSVVAGHDGGGSSTDALAREVRFHAAQEAYVRKWAGRSGWPVYRSAACAGAAARAIVLPGQRRAEAWRRARLYLRGPARCARLAGY